MSTSSLFRRYRSRLLDALQRGHMRRRNKSAGASESLEQRALLSAITYDQVTQSAIFNADANEENVVTISSPDADTLVIESQVLAGGGLVADPIVLQGGAFGNIGFSLDATQSVLTIDLSLAGSAVTAFTVNTFENNDEIRVDSTPAVTTFTLQGGTGDDVADIGSSNFVLDGVFGAVSFNGQSGTDQLLVRDFDSTVSDTVLLESGSVTGIAPAAITYAGAESITVDTSDRTPNTVNVLSTAAGVDTMLDLTFADDQGNPVLATVTIGNTAAEFGTTAGSLENIVGDLELKTSAGSMNLMVDDSSDVTGDTASITATEISGLASGTISFTAGSDITNFEVLAGSGDDTIDATDAPVGIDITGNDGADQLTGSAFDDVLLGNAGADVITAGAGNDFLDGDIGNDTLDGGDGDDLILGFDGDDVIDGGAGNDEIAGDAGADVVDGGSGDDSIDGGDGDDTLRGGTDNDTLAGGPGSDQLSGNAGGDILRGGLDDDNLDGGTGADNLSGEFGDDTITAGAGDDTVSWLVGDGNDNVIGGDPTTGAGDRMLILGSFLDDSILAAGSAGAVTVTVGGQVITIESGIEELRILAGLGDDTVTVDDLGGAIDRVNVVGGGGADRIDGRSLAGSSATFIGSRGDDLIFGSLGDDTLLGGTGNDTLIGGTGTDSLKGSSGSDDFAWASGDGSDIIDAGTGNDELTAFMTNMADTLGINAPTAATQLSIGISASLTLMGLENLDLSLRDGDDVVSIGDLTNSSLQYISANMASGDDMFDGDGMVAPITLSVLGGIGNDTLLASGGDDFLRGSSGNDILSGGAGNDELRGDAGADDITGGGGADLITGGGGADNIVGSDGSDYINGGGGSDRIEGNAGNDVIIGLSGADKVFGGAGNDILTTGQGPDKAVGGQGMDLIVGGTGLDQLFGNGGQDLIVSGDAAVSVADLRRIQNEWISGRPYEQRVDNIVDGTGSSDRVNGGSFLMNITANRTVDDDGVIDNINGGAGRDLFFADFNLDVVAGRVPNETQLDLR